MRKLFVSLLGISLVTVTEVGCQVRYMLPSMIPVTQKAPVNKIPTSSLKATTVTSRAQAINHCRKQLRSVVDSFAIDVKYGKAATEMDVLASDMLDSGLAISMEMECNGNRIVFIPQYSDCVLMLRAHKHPSFRATLTPPMSAALKKAQRIVAQVSLTNYTDYSKAVALHDYLIRNARYDSRLGNAARGDATTKLLLEGVAMCDGYAHTYGLLLSIAGIENRFIIGRADGVEHIWNLVKFNHKWTHIDVTYDDPKPDMPGRVLHAYFGLSDARISSNHQWNKKLFPRASSENFFHPVHENHRFATVRDMLNWAARNRKGRTWSVTVYIDEVAAVKSDSAVQAKLESTAHSLGIDILKNVALDPAVPGAIYCTFKN